LQRHQESTHNTTQTKSQDGVTIWYNFVRHSIELLKDQGELLVIIPSLWMRPDKEHMYTYMTRHKLCKNQMFIQHGNQQSIQRRSTNPHEYGSCTKDRE